MSFHDELLAATAAERAALNLALAAGGCPPSVTDAHFDELKKHFSEDAIIEMVSVIAFFGWLNRWNDTLATQLEKFRHSPQGLTSSPLEKLRQMASASLRAYQDGENTTAARKRIVLDYVNSIPLAAAPPYGEVIGLGDALEIWYGADFEHTNQVLRQVLDADSPYDLEPRARAYKRVLSLVLSAGRPSFYLIQDPKVLRARTDTYLRLLAEEGRISPALRDAALAAELDLRRRGAELEVQAERREQQRAADLRRRETRRPGKRKGAEQQDQEQAGERHQAAARLLEQQRLREGGELGTGEADSRPEPRQLP